MMVSMETCLLRMKRRAERWRAVPAVHWLELGTLWFGGGFLLSAARVWGQMQPIAIGLTLGSGGWRCVCAAMGSVLGYRLLWQEAGLQGAVWSIGSMVLSLVMPLLESGERLRNRLALGAACLIAGTQLAIQPRGGDVALLLLRIGLAFSAAWLAQERGRVAHWLLWGAGTMGLCGLSPILGALAAGLAVTALPLPGAMMAALGAQLGGAVLPMTAVVCISFFAPKQRAIWSSVGAGVLMLLLRLWVPWELLALIIGCIAGAALPWRIAPAARGSLGGVQVQLEQTAQVLSRLQRQLLEYVPPGPDIPALLDGLRKNSCEVCELRHSCRIQERVNDRLMQSDEPFLCRKPALAAKELRRSRSELRRIRAARSAQESYRLALVQQYGFLADALRGLSDRMAQRRQHRARFRVQVSARCRSREVADGDRVTAFPGPECRFYIVLCDGMGTGLGAAEESRTASCLIRDMLTAGLPPESVLGSLNSQLALTDSGGAVTVDLAEVRLDSGRVWLYKWGAGPSWLLRRRKTQPIGSSGPPPGLGVSTGRENVSHITMDESEVLLMLSDGIEPKHLPTCPSMQTPLGTLADRIVQEAAGEDDATAVAVRLVRVT